MRNPLKLAGVPQTTEPISAASGPKFTILWELLEETLLLNKFFFDCPFVPQLRRYSHTNLYDGAQMAIFASFLRPVFPASRVQHISDLHSKFALRPHHAAAEIRRGKKVEDRKKRQVKNIMACPIA